MRILAATKRFAGSQCRMCDRVIGVGDYVLYHHVPDVYTSAADVVVHAVCAHAAIESKVPGAFLRDMDIPVAGPGVPIKGPAPQELQAMRRSATARKRVRSERERILETGKVFQ